MIYTLDLFRILYILSFTKHMLQFYQKNPPKQNKTKKQKQTKLLIYVKVPFMTDG